MDQLSLSEINNSQGEPSKAGTTWKVEGAGAISQPQGQSEFTSQDDALDLAQTEVKVSRETHSNCSQITATAGRGAIRPITTAVLDDSELESTTNIPTPTKSFLASLKKQVQEDTTEETQHGCYDI